MSLKMWEIEKRAESNAHIILPNCLLKQGGPESAILQLELSNHIFLLFFFFQRTNGEVYGESYTFLQSRGF